MHIDRAAATVAEGFVPVVDLSSRCTAEGRADLARAIDAACTGSGFFVIVGHGIPPGTQTPAGIWPENPPESAGVPEGPAGAHDGHGHATGHCSPPPSTTTPRSSPAPARPVARRPPHRRPPGFGPRHTRGSWWDPPALPIRWTQAIGRAGGHRRGSHPAFPGMMVPGGPHRRPRSAARRAERET